jgi:hypothetical protein
MRLWRNFPDPAIASAPVILPARVFLFLALFATANAVDTSFPLLEHARRVRGALESVDFIHRTGQFRTERGGRMDFTMPPYGIMKHQGGEADLRDVLLGTRMEFVLLPDATGAFTRLVTTESSAPVDPAQQQKFADFTKARGIAGWIDKTEGREVTVTFFSGNPAAFRAAYESLLVKDKEVRLCVANDELRTWNPGVDGERSVIAEVTQLPTDRFGCSGCRIVARVTNMLEGFRRGRVVRVFLQGWKAQDQFYGESLMGYGFGRMLNQELVENVAKEYPDQFPFRTDYGNDELPWYPLKPEQEPPPFSEHVVCGSLVKPGQFLTEGAGQAVDFILLTTAKVRYLGKDARIEDIPPGTRCRFSLYQDEKGAFTKVSLLSDDFSHRAGTFVTLRVDAVRLNENRIDVSWMLPDVKDYNGDMQRPQPIGHSILRVTKDTRAWKLDKRIELVDLAVGDMMLINTTAELPGQPAQCADLWIGDDTIKLVSGVKKQGAKK